MTLANAPARRLAPINGFNRSLLSKNRDRHAIGGARTPAPESADAPPKIICF
jgi:hypothetical protein